MDIMKDWKIKKIIQNKIYISIKRLVIKFDITWYIFLFFIISRKCIPIKIKGKYFIENQIKLFKRHYHQLISLQILL
jgi:hypothetical protein